MLCNDCIGIIIEFFDSPKILFSLMILNSSVRNYIKNIGYYRCKNIMFRIIANAPSVKYVYRARIESKLLKYLGIHGLENLRYLDMGINTKITNRGIIYLKHLKVLKMKNNKKISEIGI